MEDPKSWGELEHLAKTSLTVAIGSLETAGTSRVDLVQAKSDALEALRELQDHLDGLVVLCRAAYRTSGDLRSSNMSPVRVLEEGLFSILGKEKVQVRDARVEAPLPTVQSLLGLLSWALGSITATATLEGEVLRVSPQRNIPKFGLLILGTEALGVEAQIGVEGALEVLFRSGTAKGDDRRRA